MNKDKNNESNDMKRVEFKVYKEKRHETFSEVCGQLHSAHTSVGLALELFTNWIIEEHNIPPIPSKELEPEMDPGIPVYDSKKIEEWAVNYPEYKMIERIEDELSVIECSLSRFNLDVVQILMKEDWGGDLEDY